MLTYLDRADGRMRVKRRYLWGFWGFTAGFVLSSLLFILLSL